MNFRQSLLVLGVYWPRHQDSQNFKKSFANTFYLGIHCKPQVATTSILKTNWSDEEIARRVHFIIC